MENLPLVTDSLDGIDEPYQGMYAKDEESGKYNFQTPDALLRAKQREKDSKQEKSAELESLTERLKSLEDERKAERDAIAEQKRQLELDAAKKSGDWEAIEKSHIEQREKLQESLQAEIKRRDGMISDLTVNQEAHKLAANLAGENAAVILPHIQKRLKSEIGENGASTRVLSQDGKPSALSLDDLRNEFYNDKSFSSIIVGSKGSGGGADGSNGKGGGATGTTMKRSDFLAKPESERKSLIKEGINLT